MIELTPIVSGGVAQLKDTNYVISTFGKDEAGEIYFADYFGGAVYRVDAPHTLPPPVISPAARTYTSRVSFTIRTDVPGAVVRYTTDGTTPSEGSMLFPTGQMLERTGGNADVVRTRGTQSDA